MTLRAVALLCLVIAVGACSSREPAQAASCDAILGKWTWFTQGVVTFNADRTMVHEPGNAGTWECSDAGRGAVTLHWRDGGYVNRVALSQDGSALSSTDPSQPFVSARRIDHQGTSQPDARVPANPAGTALILATQPEGGRALPKDLPELMRRATERAHTWRADAVPVAMEFQYLDAPNPRLLKGPQVRLSFLSPSDGTGEFVTVTTAGASTVAVNQRVTWGTVSLPPVFVDLPAAVRIAVANGAHGPIDRASLRVWNPNGASPVLAWMVGSKTVNGTTGELIDFDVTGYIAKYNAQWEHAAKGLRALLRATQRRSSGSGFPMPGGGGNPGSADQPYDDGSAARQEYERNAAESRAYWELSTEDYNRVKGGDCSWSDSSNGHC